MCVCVIFSVPLCLSAPPSAALPVFFWRCAAVDGGSRLGSAAAAAPEKDSGLPDLLLLPV